ncbi:Satratoxin biosynthesis SC1 cluster protein 4 [Fusarium oxysporum f. sp. albedinis]|nr:hypothetical protein HZ326_25654 [Fusarium oxysporum f. sp. albedinis]KAJ0136511.1 Satratoxin biosynthesis SC1 cluster protein 4 [Fusarium oxysporum f. sp. albedinis]
MPQNLVEPSGLVLKVSLIFQRENIDFTIHVGCPGKLIVTPQCRYHLVVDMGPCIAQSINLKISQAKQPRIQLSPIASELKQLATDFNARGLLFQSPQLNERHPPSERVFRLVCAIISRKTLKTFCSIVQAWNPSTWTRIRAKGRFPSSIAEHCS